MLSTIETKPRTTNEDTVALLELYVLYGLVDALASQVELMLRSSQKPSAYLERLACLSQAVKTATYHG